MITFGHGGAFGGFRSKYLRKGMSAMSKQTVDTLVSIKTKYSDFVRFFKSMKMRYKGTDTEPEIDETLNALYNVQRQLGTVLYAKGRPATDAEISDMLSSIELIDSRIVDFSRRMVGDAELRKKAEAASEKTLVSVDALSESSKAIKESMSKMPGTKGGKLSVQDIKEAAPELFEGGKQLGKGLLTAALGPFAGMALAAGGGTLGIAKKIIAKRQEAKRMQMAQRLMPVSQMSAEGMKEQMELSRQTAPYLEQVTRRRKDTDYEPELGRPGLEEPQELVKPIRKRRGVETVGGRATIEDIAAPKPLTRAQRELGGKDKVQKQLIKTHAMSLEQFFGKPAYKAAYTKELMKLMRKIAGVKGGGIGGERDGGGLLGNMMGIHLGVQALKTLWPLLVGLGPVMAGIAIAAANLGMQIRAIMKHGALGASVHWSTLEGFDIGTAIGKKLFDKEGRKELIKEGMDAGRLGRAAAGGGVGLVDAARDWYSTISKPKSALGKGRAEGSPSSGFVTEVNVPKAAITKPSLSKIEEAPPAMSGISSLLSAIYESFDNTSKATIKALKDMTSGSQTIPGRGRSSHTADPVASVASGDYG